MSKAQEWLYSFRDEKVVKKRSVRTISVTAGKGGVGKTSVAVKLSLELARLNKKVLLIDCDYNLSNTFIKLGLPINENFYSLISGQKDFSECVYKENNFHLLSGCNGNQDLIGKEINFAQFVIDIINGHENEYDFIILDCPAGLSSTTLTLNAYCHDRFFIVTPDKSSLTDSYSLIKLLKIKHNILTNHLVVNKVSTLSQYHKVVKTLSETIEHFLGCRTICLGGVQLYTGEIDSFDNTLIKIADAGINKNLIKVIENYTEKFLGQSSHFQDVPTSLGGLPVDQEVHST